MPENRKQLRNFGFLFAGMLALVFGFVLPYFFEYSRPDWPLIVATVLIFCSLTFPRGLIIIKKPWMRLAKVLGKVNSFIILGLIFYAMITPYAFVLKMLRKKPIKSRVFRQTESYWIKSQVRDKSQMETPY
tara:strand:- start:695 stop:1087 length:393 start_codon:yes stop_codon:yes gene_type:complete